MTTTMAEGSLRSSTGSSKRNRWSLNFSARHRDGNKGELAAPPGYCPSAAQLQAEDRKESVDAQLIAKVSF